MSYTFTINSTGATEDIPVFTDTTGMTFKMVLNKGGGAAPVEVTSGLVAAPGKVTLTIASANVPTFAGSDFSLVGTKAGADTVLNTGHIYLYAPPAQTGIYAAKSGGNVFTGNQQINGGLGVGSGSDIKQPIPFHATLDGPAVRASGSQLDKIGHSISLTVTGDFTGDTGSNPGFVWGQNVFLIVGSNPGDGKGLADINGSLIEANISTPAGTTLGIVRGLGAQAAFFGPSAGAHVGIIESMRVMAPARKDGATAGTADMVYGLFVEGVDAAAVGASGALSMFVSSGVSRFGGRVDVDGQIVASGVGDMRLSADFTSGAWLGLSKNVNGGHAVIQLGSAASVFAVASAGGGGNVLQMDNTGALALSLASTTTAPGAGGAGALPATPSGYATLTINGTARKVAYY